MGFNYLQTDDRDDYFAQFDRHKKSYTRYAIKKEGFESNWCGIKDLRGILNQQTGFKWKDTKGITTEDLMNILTNEGYLIHKEKLPHLVGFPKHKWLEEREK
jgi:hypothetical protein